MNNLVGDVKANPNDFYRYINSQQKDAQCIPPLIKRNDIDILNDFHKDVLRRIQHLPQRTALPVVYGLVGQFPIEFELHRRQFTLFGNIIREDCIEKNLAFRQLAVKMITLIVGLL